jgi:hypothetical protein
VRRALIRPKTLYVSALGELHCLATTDLRSTRRHLRVVGKHKLLTKHGLHSAKTLNFSVATSGPRLLTTKLKDFAFLSGDAVIARCSLDLRSGRLRGAVFHNARSLRSAQNAFPKHLKSALNLPLSSIRVSPLGDCAPRLSRTDSEFGLWGNVIICAVLAALSAVPPRTPTRKAGRPAAGAEIITN